MRVRGGSGAAAGPVPPPAGLRPMHPTAARELPADQRGWAFEPKWDGYRALGHIVGGELALRSRNGVDMAGWFPELAGLAGALGDRAGVLDGQTVASFAGAGTALLAATREQGLEGVVAKKLQSAYVPGRRTRSWLKVKHYQRETFLVGGFVLDHDQVRSLLVGLPDPGRPGGLVFCGRVDHGVVPAARRRVRELLGPLVTGRSPFAEPPSALLGGRWSRPGPDDPAPVFVRPELAVEVSFLGWESGRLRHPAYSGLTRIL